MIAPPRRVVMRIQLLLSGTELFTVKRSTLEHFAVLWQFFASFKVCLIAILQPPNHDLLAVTLFVDWQLPKKKENNMVHYWRICYVKLPDTTTLAGTPSVWFCIRIKDIVGGPLVVPINAGPPVPPEPPEFEGTGLSPEEIRNMERLAAIDRIAQSLPAQMSHEVQRSVEAHMKTLGQHLAEGFELSRADFKAPAG